MRPTGVRGKWAKPWLTGFWIVILLTTLTVPAWAESFADQYSGAAITQNHRLTVAEPGEVNVLKDVDFGTSVAFGESLLTSPEFSKGRLQPYFTVGATPFVVQAEDSANFLPPDQSYTDTSVRVKVGAGVTWFLFRDIAIFGEYRPEFQLRDGPEPVTLESDVNTHQIVGGISLRFH